MSKTLLFVCLHGAAKSRMAAAFFNQLSPAGWTATSAAVEPQAELGLTALRLLEGTEAAAYLDTNLPRPIDQVVEPAITIAIDCDVAGAEKWELTARHFNEALRAELQTRVSTLVTGLPGEVAL